MPHGIDPGHIKRPPGHIQSHNSGAPQKIRAGYGQNPAPRADIQDRERGVRRKVFPDKINNAFCFRSGNKYIRGDDKIQAIELLLGIRSSRLFRPTAPKKDSVYGRLLHSRFYAFDKAHDVFNRKRKIA